MPTITTIVPTYNRSSFLTRAISSIREQSWTDIRIVVRDNCSTDDTESVVSNIALHDSRVFYEKQTRNLGSIENIRQGISGVNTEYFSCLCDDDYLEPGFYREAIRLFEKYPEAGFIAFRVNIVDVNGKFINSNVKNCGGPLSETFYSSEVGLKRYFRAELPYALNGYIFKKSVAESIDFGDFSEVGYGADLFFIWHAASRFNFVVTNFLAGNFTAHDKSTSATLVHTFDERFLYWWRNRLNIIRSDPLVNDSVKKIISDYYYSNSSKSINGLKYYTHAAIIFILYKVKSGRVADLKSDFIAMRSFLPFSLLISIKYCILVLVYFKLDIFLRNFICRARDGFKIS